MLTITPGADEALAMLRDQAEDLPPGGGVRVTRDADEDGASGFALGLVEAPESDDMVVDGHALAVFVAAGAAADLEDMALDGEVHGDHVHFGFTPHEAEPG